MDTTPIMARLNRIANAVSALKELQQLPFEEFAADHFLQSAAERDMQVAIQAALDIGSTLLAELSTKIPENYADIFPELADVGILPYDFAQKLMNMAKFRNILVHMYLEIDIARMYGYIQQNLDDLVLFTRYISEYIARSNPG